MAHAAPEETEFVEPHSEGSSKYMLPSDDQELDRLTSQHHVFKYLLNGNIKSPIETALQSGIKVLDVGCGPAVWTLEMAKSYPASDFVGVDLADVVPKENIPSNCTFLRGDTLKGLPFEDNSFDYVYQRLLVFAFTPDDWSTAVQELIRIVKPGGYIELVEAGPIMDNPGPTYSLYQKIVIDASAARGIDFDFISKIPSLLRSAGLEDVVSDVLTNPIGWGGRVGELNVRTLLNAMKALRHNPALRGTSSEEFEATMKSVEIECAESKTVGSLQYVFGRKPIRIEV